MLIPNHPHDERLSALASRESDATADATLTAHVSSCERCAALVDELAALRAALADLPDLAPSRPLRLIPPVEAAPVSAADRLGGWARRFFAPVLASGAALALVGTIGTAAPSFSGPQAGGAESEAGADQRVTLQAEEPQASAEFEAEASEAAAGAPSEAAPAEAAASAAITGDAAELRSSPSTEAAAAPEGTDHAVGSTYDFAESDEDRSLDALAAERSPWPMVLVAGVALMVGALLMRWILVPRSG